MLRPRPVPVLPPVIPAPGSHASRAPGYLLIALSNLGFAHKGVFFALLLPYGLSGLDVSAVRWIAGLLPVWIASRLTVPSEARRWPRGAVLRRFLLGAGISATCSALHTQAFVYLDAPVAAVAVFVYPAFIILGDALRKRRVPGAAAWAQLALLGTALWLLGRPGPDAVPRPEAWKGFALCLGCAVLWVVYLRTSATLLRRPGQTEGMHPITFTYLSALTTATYGVIHVWALGPPIPGPTDQPFWLLVAGLALFASTVPGMAMFAGLARLGASRGGIMMAMSPGVSAVATSLWLQEPLGPVRTVGVIAIILAALPVWRR